MNKTILIWYRNDLRVHDHPALEAAAAAADYVVPIFVLDDNLLKSDHASANRNRFLLQSLADLKKSLQALGADLVIRSGKAEKVLLELADDTAADAIYYTADYTPYAVRRDQSVMAAASQAGLTIQAYGGRLAVDRLPALQTKSGNPYKVFTPFWKNWQRLERRPLATVPAGLKLPPGLHVGRLPDEHELCDSDELSSAAITGGETAGRSLLEAWLDAGVKSYHLNQNDMAAEGTSHLSAHLHFGTVSVREIEELLPRGAGAEAFHRQLAWREFYQYVLFMFPDNKTREFQEAKRELRWDTDANLLQAWQAGKTGYPIVDAAMRQLRQEGWMHNRGRLIVGSFLTKDLWLDWRLGESFFMRWLVDGDSANNNGNWQWIASVGVDPAPVFRRLYNPTAQQRRYDPTGQYVRRYVPELRNVPDDQLAEPWKLRPDEQAAAGCVIGQDYPAPIVDHAQARQAALERFRKA